MILSMAWGSDAARWCGALAVCAAYAALCAGIWRGALVRRTQARQAAADLSPAEGDVAPWIVAYASQTGAAEHIAWQTARALRAGGTPARICALSDITFPALQQAGRAIFVVSTYGEGDPPDNAASFAALMADDVPPSALQGLRFAVLALGDAEYRHFCGFGRSLFEWLSRHGGQALFDRVDVDKLDAESLQRWQRHLERIGIEASGSDWAGPAFEGWELSARRWLNPDSEGRPTFEVELQPMHGQPTWQAGDLAQVLVPADPDRARDYSIASLPSEGALRLLVRQEHHDNGTLGLASGWLTAHASLGSEIQLRLRPNKNFQAEGNADRPLILIGNGTGLAGLRAHLRARAEAAWASDRAPMAPGIDTGVPGRTGHWLLFGERQRGHDFYWKDDIEGWQRRGVLERVDLAFSRDQPAKLYVQDLLRLHANTVRAWLEAGAALYVCGSLAGMASGVHDALVDIIGEQQVRVLTAERRYRRDVY